MIPFGVLLDWMWFLDDIAQTVLRVVTPEQMFLVETPSVQDKHKWMALSQRTINKHLQKKNISFEGTSLSYFFTVRHVIMFFN